MLSALERAPRAHHVAMESRQLATVEAGDHYAVLGRGLALSFFRKYAICSAWTTHFAVVALRMTRIVSTHAWLPAFSNPQNIDPHKLVDLARSARRDRGRRVGTRIGANDELELGAHAVHIEFEDDADNFQIDRNLTVLGWKVAAPALFDGRLALYGEVDALIRGWSENDEHKRDVVVPRTLSRAY